MTARNLTQLSQLVADLQAKQGADLVTQVTADSSVRSVTSTVMKMSGSWPMLTALMDGTGAMRAAGKTFMPQWPNEADGSYKARLNSATLYPVFKRTVLVNAMRPFSKPMVVTIKGAAIPDFEEWQDNIDLKGSSIAAFSSQIMKGVLSHGVGGVLVEYPPTTGVMSKEDEQVAGARPYLVHYPDSTILGWRSEVISGVTVLTQLRLLETVTVDEGLFGTKEVEQVRLLTPGAWATYRLSTEDNKTWIRNDGGETTMKVVPFVFFYGDRTGFGTGISPLLDMAYMNVEHWQSASDQQTIMHVARVPVLFAKGFGDKVITIGAGTAASTDNETAELSYVEHSGAAIGAGRTSLQDLEERMRATGAELIAQKPSHVTATQIDSESEASKSLLQQITEIFEESLEDCLHYMLTWVGTSGDVEVELYKDFDQDSGIDPQNLTEASKAGAISRQTLFSELKRRDVLSPDLTWEEEQKQLLSELKLFGSAIGNPVTPPAPTNPDNKT